MSTPNDPYAPGPIQPPATYPADPQGAYGQGPYGQPPQAPYGHVPSGATGPDTRPKGLGWAALGLAIGAVVLMIASFFTTVIAWVGLTLSILALLVGTAAIIVGIVVLVKKTLGFKVGGILGIVGGVIAGLAWFTLITGILFTGWFTTAGSTGQLPDVESTPSASAEATESAEPTEDADAGDTTAEGSYDPEAFVAQVRPQLDEIMADVNPAFTPEVVAQTYTDEILIANGELFATLGSLQGMEAERTAFVEEVISASGGLFNEDTANRFFDVMTTAAAEHLVR